MYQILKLSNLLFSFFERIILLENMNNILSFLAGTLTGGLGLKIFEKVWDWKFGEYVDNRRQKKLNKFDLSTEILKILNEGSNVGWKKRPNDVNHLNYIGRLLQMQDEKLSKKYDHLISLWQITADRNTRVFVRVINLDEPYQQKMNERDKEDEKFIADNVNELNTLDKEISDELRKWR